MRSRGSRGVAGVVLIASVVACGLLAPVTVEAHGRAGTSPLQGSPVVQKGVVGQPLPNLSALNYESKPAPVPLATFRGKATIITFWATWCGPCLKEMPTFQKLVENYKGRLQVVAIAMMDQRAAAEAFVRKHPEYHFVFLHDPDAEGGESKLANAFGILGLPTNLFVDASGTVRDQWMGSASEEALLKHVQGLMQ